MPEEHSDEELQLMARNLFLGVAPERAAALQALWEAYQPRFNILPDNGKDGALVMKAGLYRFVRFNHRLLRVMWLLSYAAWEGYVAIHESSHNPSGAVNLDKFREILQCVDAICAAEKPAHVPFPPAIPQPGELIEHRPGTGSSGCPRLCTVPSRTSHRTIAERLASLIRREQHRPKVYGAKSVGPKCHQIGSVQWVPSKGTQWEY